MVRIQFQVRLMAGNSGKIGGRSTWREVTHALRHFEGQHHAIGKPDRGEGLQEAAAAKARFAVRPELQGAFKGGGFAADGGLVGLEVCADGVEAEMHRLAAVEEEVHAGDNVNDGSRPDPGLAAEAVG